MTSFSFFEGILQISTIITPWQTFTLIMRVFFFFLQRAFSLLVHMHRQIAPGESAEKQVDFIAPGPTNTAFSPPSPTLSLPAKKGEEQILRMNWFTEKGCNKKRGE
jgi:hypothetical protein